VLETLASRGPPIRIVGTRATLAAQTFELRLDALGHLVLLPTEAEVAESILPSIGLVKEGRAMRAGEVQTPTVQGLFDRGATSVSLACTETPSPLRASCADSNRALARACVVR